jgi:hypothetical protein
MELIERHVTISNEALAVFACFWVTSTPALPNTALAAAQTKARERYEGFVETLGRRLARGRKLADEVSLDVTPDCRMSVPASEIQGDDQSRCVSVSSSSGRPSAGRYRPKFNSKSLGRP